MKTDRLFANGKPVIGMIHTNHTDKVSTLQLAQREIGIYLKHGVYPLIENYFGDDDDCEDVLRWMQQKHPGEIYGLNILGNFYRSFELAEKYGASFIQIDSVCGHLKPALDEEYESALKLLRSNSDCTVLGGVRFKYQLRRNCMHGRRDWLGHPDGEGGEIQANSGRFPCHHRRWRDHRYD